MADYAEPVFFVGKDMDFWGRSLLASCMFRGVGAVINALRKLLINGGLRRDAVQTNSPVDQE
jgi:hypothetical protein